VLHVRTHALHRVDHVFSGRCATVQDTHRQTVRLLSTVQSLVSLSVILVNENENGEKRKK